MEFRTWCKSSYSAEEGSCVEVGSLAQAVGVRDSKLADESPVLVFSREAWASFMASLK